MGSDCRQRQNSDDIAGIVFESCRLDASHWCWLLSTVIGSSNGSVSAKFHLVLLVSPSPHSHSLVRSLITKYRDIIPHDIVSIPSQPYR